MLMMIGYLLFVNFRANPQEFVKSFRKSGSVAWMYETFIVSLILEPLVAFTLHSSFFMNSYSNS